MEFSWRLVVNLLINVDVPDVSRAERFYTQAFGLTVKRRFGANGVELAGLPCSLFLLKKDDGSLPFNGAEQPRTYKRHWTPVHFDVVVDSIDEASAKVRSAGGLQEGEVTTAKWGKLALFVDPFGNGFCLVEFLGRGYDEIAT